MNALIKQWSQVALESLTHVKWLAPLILRITVGYSFFVIGLGKLNNLDRVAQFFTSLGIPFPGFNALLVAGTETLGGLLILVGLLTRLISIPLSITMVVAILTAQLGKIGNLTDFLGLIEWIYLVIFINLMINGPGKMSLDHYLAQKLKMEP